MTSPTPEDPANLTNIEATPEVDDASSLSIQGGTGVPTDGTEVPADGAKVPTAVPTLGGDQPYPKAGQSQSTTGASEVIYESDQTVPSAVEPEIPPDPNSR